VGPIPLETMTFGGSAIDDSRRCWDRKGSSMKVNRLMTRDLATVPLDSTLKEAARIMIDRKVSGLPVVDDDGVLVGVVTEGDILHLESIRNPATTIKSLLRRSVPNTESTEDAMTSKVISIAPDADHTEAARLMESAGVKRLPVIDSAGKLVGIFSRSDVLKVFARPDLDIHDELLSEVIEKILWLDPDTVVVSVSEGHVMLNGEVPTRSDTRILEEMAKRVDGVIDVDASGLSYTVDDTRRSN
jgi:CBS domain-containing protein